MKRKTTLRNSKELKLMILLVMGVIFILLSNELCREWTANVEIIGKVISLALKNRIEILANFTIENKKGLMLISKEAKLNETCTVRLHYKNPIIQVRMNALPWNELEKKFKYLLHGGHHIPRNCMSPNRVAVVIPYRDRERHLRILLNNMHTFLTEQELDYSIFVIEQTVNQTFNRGKLLNVGFIEAMKLYDWECVLLHDVDLLPEDKRNLHLCPKRNPRHMAVAMDKYNYKLFYNKMFGTSSMFTTKQYLDVNGHSNRYWGWGGEDDDMYTRTYLAGYKVARYNNTIARYTMIRHGKDVQNPDNPCRFSLLNHTAADWKRDGLSSLHYKLLDIRLKPLYTHILVDLLEREERPTLIHYCDVNNTDSTSSVSHSMSTHSTLIQ